MTQRRALSQIFINMGSGWLAAATQMAISLAMVPFLLLHLGKDGYGLIGILGAIVGLTEVADLGLRAALTRELAEHVAKRDKRAFSEIASTGFATYLSLAICFSIILYIIAPWLIVIAKIPDSLQPDALNLLRIYGVWSVILSFIMPAYTAGLASHHRYDVINGVQLANGILCNLILFAVISHVKQPLYGWMFVVMVMSLVSSAAIILLFFKIVSGNPIHLRQVRINRLRSLLNLGGKMYALQLANIFAERADPLIISYFQGPSGVALYQTGQKLSQSLRPIVLTLVAQIEPITTRSHVLRRQDQEQKILIYGTKFTTLLGSLATAGTISLAYPFCNLWLGNTLGKDSLIVAKVMTLWAIADLITYAAGSQFPILLGMKKLNFLICTQLPPAVLNIAMSIYMVGFTSLGLASVLYSTIIINLIRRPILMWYTANQCGLTLSQYFLQAYARALACFTITLICGLAIRDIVSSWQSLIFAALCICLSWLAACLCIGLNREERLIIMTQVFSVIRR
jgi:O-antigen/teichoic acid export membrane protein